MPRGRPRKLKEGVTPEPMEVITSAKVFEDEIISEDKVVTGFEVEGMIKCAHDSFHQPDLYSKKNMIEKDGQFYCSENCASYH